MIEEEGTIRVYSPFVWSALISSAFIDCISIVWDSFSVIVGTSKNCTEPETAALLEFESEVLILLFGAAIVNYWKQGGGGENGAMNGSDCTGGSSVDCFVNKYYEWCRVRRVVVMQYSAVCCWMSSATLAGERRGTTSMTPLQICWGKAGVDAFQLGCSVGLFFDIMKIAGSLSKHGTEKTKHKQGTQGTRNIHRRRWGTVTLK